MTRDRLLIILFTIPCLLAWAAGISAAVTAANPKRTDYPFRPGEKLTFRLRWEFVPAGSATLEVFPMATFNGETVYHFSVTAKSNSFIDIFYKVRDKIDAYADVEMTHSLRYTKKQREGRTKRDVVVEFDWDAHQARYINFNKHERTTDIMPGTFDPLSVFYYSRFLQQNAGDILSRPVTDGKKCVIGIAKIVKKEKVKVPAGTFETHLFEPEAKHIGGVFKQSKNAKIQVWVTADKRHIPVKVRSRVIVGRFVGELVSVEGVGESLLGN